LLEKSGYQDLTLLDMVPSKELAKIPMFFQEILKQPKESGLDLDQQVHFFADFSSKLSKKRKGEIVEPAIVGGLSLGIKDTKALHKLITNLMEYADQEEGVPSITKESVDGNTVLTFEDENTFTLAYGKNELLLLGSNYSEIHSSIKNKKQKKGLPEPAAWLREQALQFLTPAEDAEVPEALAHNQKSKDDVQFYMDYKRFMDIAQMAEASEQEKQLLESLFNNPAFSIFKNMKIAMGLNFEPGKIHVHSEYLLSEENPFAAAMGDGLAPELLNILPAEPAMYWAVSSNISEVRETIGEIYIPIIKELVGGEEGEEFDMDSPLPIVELSLNELLSIFEGDMVLYLKDVIKTPGPIPLPQADFILGMKLNNRELFDEVLDKLTRPKKPDAEPANIDQMLGAFGLALTRKDNAVFLSHSKYGREIEVGKSLNPVEEEHQKVLSKNYSNGYINVSRVVSIIKNWIPPQQLAQKETKEFLKFCDQFETMTFTQDKNMRSVMELNLTNKEKNSLRIFTEFVKQVAEKRSPAHTGKTEKTPPKKPEPKPKKDPEPQKPKSTLIPSPPPPLPGSTPYQIPSSKELDLNDDGYFQKYLATFRGELSDEEKKLIGRWKGSNDSTDANEWEILQRKDRSFTLVIRSVSREQPWEAAPVLHGAWRIDGGRLLYVVLQVENMHLSLSDIEINSEKVKTLNKKTLITVGEEESGNPFTSEQHRVKRFEGPRMWEYNNPESLENFTFHIPPKPEE